MDADISITTLVALYGAVMSSFGVALTCYAITRERSRLFIRLSSINPEASPSGDGDTKYYYVCVANLGRRTATVQELSLECRDSAKKLHRCRPAYVVDEKGQQRAYDSPLRPNFFVGEGTVLWFMIPACGHEVVPHAIKVTDGRLRQHTIRPRNRLLRWWIFRIDPSLLSTSEDESDLVAGGGESPQIRNGAGTAHAPYFVWSRAERLKRRRALRRKKRIIAEHERLMGRIAEGSSGSPPSTRLNVGPAGKPFRPS